MRKLRVCGFVLLLLLAAAPARGADFPALSGPAVYAGEFVDEDETYSVLLLLSDSYNFVLRENFILPNGNKSGWEARGKWHQIRGGAFLQLSNRSGFCRLMNIGGSGNLYLGMQLPTGPLVTVYLRQQSTEPYAEELAGLAVMPEPEPQLEPRALRAIWNAVAGGTWMVTRAGYGQAAAHAERIGCTLSFMPERGKNRGRLELFDGVRHATGDYALNDAGLSFSVSTDIMEFAELLKDTRSWEMSGEVLELWGENRVLAVLEKMR